MTRLSLASMVALSLAAAALPESNPLASVAWLTGCWEASRPNATIEEHWLAPRGGVMLEVGRTVRNDSLAEYEMVVLRARGGRLVYESHPSGQPSAEFTSTAASDSEVVFENPAHDFPRRVGYRRAGADSLVAWIDGGAGTRRVEFRYRRVACAP